MQGGIRLYKDGSKETTKRQIYIKQKNKWEKYLEKKMAKQLQKANPARMNLIIPLTI